MGGLPVTVSTNGFGLGVTPVATGGLAVSDTTGTLFGPAVIPANLTPPVISGTTTVGQTLTTTVGTWSGTLASYTYQWKRGGVNIAGATSNIYTLVTADGTTNITVTVTATNPAGSASATSAAVGPITPLVLPANTVLPVISGTATVGQTLTTTSGTWTGTAPITYAYQWKRGGTSISGATANTYALVTADAGSTITVTVTATNAAGNTSATSAATGAVLGVPVNSVLPAISGTTNVGQTLTTTTGTWSGSPSYAYQWLRNGSGISGATASTYLLVSGDATTNVSVTVTATNGAGSANATSSPVGPIASGPVEDPATTAWVNAVIAAGGTVSTTQRGRVDTLITAYKAAGVWALLDNEWLFAAENRPQAKVDIVRLAQWSEPNGPMILTVMRGLKDGNLGTYLDLGFAPSAGVNFQQNAASYGFYALTSRTGDSVVKGMGSAASATGSYCTLRTLQGGTTEHTLNDSYWSGVANPNAWGSYIVTRTNSTTINLYKNNALLLGATTGAALARPTYNWFVFAYNLDGTGTGGFVFQDELASAFIGGAMNNTQALAKNAALNAYMTSAGCNVY
jgi:hypothetical protein